MRTSLLVLLFVSLVSADTLVCSNWPATTAMPLWGLKSSSAPMANYANSKTLAFKFNVPTDYSWTIDYALISVNIQQSPYTIIYDLFNGTLPGATKIFSGSVNATGAVSSNHVINLTLSTPTTIYGPLTSYLVLSSVNTAVRVATSASASIRAYCGSSCMSPSCSCTTNNPYVGSTNTWVNGASTSAGTDYAAGAFCLYGTSQYVPPGTTTTSGGTTTSAMTTTAGGATTTTAGQTTSAGPSSSSGKTNSAASSLSSWLSTFTTRNLVD